MPEPLPMQIATRDERRAAEERIIELDKALRIRPEDLYLSYLRRLAATAAMHAHAQIERGDDDAKT